MLLPQQLNLVVLQLFQRAGILNQHFNSKSGAICAEYNSKQGQIDSNLKWRKQLAGDLNAVRGDGSRCNARHVAQFLSGLVEQTQQLVTVYWQPAANVTAVLEQQYAQVGDKPSKQQLWSAVESVSSISPVPLTQQHMEEWWRRRKAGDLAAPAPGPSLLRWWQQQQQDPQQAAEAHQMLQMLQPQQGITAQQVMQVLQQQQQPQQQQHQPNQQQQQPNQQQQEDQQPAQQQQRRRRTAARNPAPEGRGAAGFWYNKHPALRDMFVESADSVFEAQLQSRSQQQQQQQQQQGEQATEAWQDRAQRQRLAKEVLQQLTPKDVLKQLKSKPAGQTRSEWQKKLHDARIQMNVKRVKSLFESWRLASLVEQSCIRRLLVLLLSLLRFLFALLVGHGFPVAPVKVHCSTQRCA